MTDGGFAIGCARRDELAAVAELASQTFRDAWPEAGFAGLVDTPTSVALVARASDRTLAGFLVGYVVEDELHLLSVAVATSSRRIGLASALLRAALATGDIAVVHLEVRPSNVAARAFYANHGFQEVGLRKGYYGDGEDALLLSREESRTSDTLRCGG